MRPSVEPRDLIGAARGGRDPTQPRCTTGRRLALRVIQAQEGCSFAGNRLTPAVGFATVSVSNGTACDGTDGTRDDSAGNRAHGGSRSSAGTGGTARKEGCKDDGGEVYDDCFHAGVSGWVLNQTISLHELGHFRGYGRITGRPVRVVRATCEVIAFLNLDCFRSLNTTRRVAATPQIIGP